jgi:uncharacterized protein YjbI with pentapeptide repeats
LTKANLTGAKLRGVRLTKTILTCATLTGANLYGTARDDWQIDGIRCDYIYWNDKPLFEQQNEEEQWLAAHRMPLDRDFRPGEFEELYKQLPTFEYYFEHGFTPLDPLIMDQVVQAINARHPEFELRLKNFEATGTPHATLTVIHKEHVEAAKTQLTTDYEARLAALEGKQEQMMELFAQVVNNPQLIVAGDLTIGNKRMIQSGRDYLEQIGGDAHTGDTSEESERNTSND